ncbi:hypothetical protein QQF64_005161 [Cirrhinus molitorella]|uniref:Uncharacterized protein n=1 Tax=Cirrhinus molitorella TaxID=172907 RepID=A0ABR3MK12_9TELE
MDLSVRSGSPLFSLVVLVSIEEAHFARGEDISSFSQPPVLMVTSLIDQSSVRFITEHQQKPVFPAHALKQVHSASVCITQLRCSEATKNSFFALWCNMGTSPSVQVGPWASSLIPVAPGIRHALF